MGKIKYKPKVKIILGPDSVQFEDGSVLKGIETKDV